MKTISLLCLLICLSSFGAQDNESFLDLVNAVKRLRHKTRPQSYFILGPGLKQPVFCVSDAKGGAFILLTQWKSIPEKVDITKQKKEYEALQIELGHLRVPFPEIDLKAKRLILYSKAELDRIIKVMQKWQVKVNTIEDVLESNKWNKKDFDLVLKIPKGEEKEFMSIFIGNALRISLKDFRCSIGWN